MTPHPLSYFSRAGFERAFAGLLFSATVALMAAGSLAMTLSSAFAG